MSKGNSNLWLYLGLGGLAYLFLSGSSSSGSPVASLTNTLTSLIPGSTPTPPAAYDETYYLTYVYPLMQQQNPNILNPNYNLSPTDAATYLANYPTLGPALNAWPATPSGDNTLQTKVMEHWHMYGVPNKRTFLPLWAPYTGTTPLVPGSVADMTTQQAIQEINPALNVAPKKSGGGFFSGLLTGLTDVAEIIPAAAKILGIETKSKVYSLPTQAEELSTIIGGAKIALDILPYYYSEAGSNALQLDANINEILTNTLS